MKDKVWHLLKVFSKGCIEMVFYSFIWLPLAFYSLTWLGTILWVVLLLVSYSSFNIVLNNRKTTYSHVALVTSISTILLSAILYTQLQYNNNFVLYIAIIVFSLIFTICGYRQYSKHFNFSFTISMMGFAFLGHIALQIIKTIWLEEMVEINVWLYLFGVTSLIFMMFITNERMLLEQQKYIGHSTAHKHALQMNRILISIFSVIMISVIVFRSWQEKIEHWIKQFINWLIGLFNRDVGEKQLAEEEVEYVTPQFPGVGEEETSPHWIMELLEKVIIIIAYIAFGIFLIIVLLLIVRILKGLISKIMAFLNTNASKVEDEQFLFIDEVEEIEKADNKVRRKLKLASSEKVNWKKLSMSEKCQYLYVLFIKKAEHYGHHYIYHLTVNEQVKYVVDKFDVNLSEEEAKWLTRIYNEARYGQSIANLDVTAQEYLEKLYRKFTSKS